MIDLRKKIFELAKEQLATDGRVLMELATSFGKTKLSLDLSIHLGAINATVLVPTDPIGEAWDQEVIKWNCPLKVKTVNYLSVHKILDSDIPPDVIIMDECHHVTARSAEFIAQFKCPVIAISATVNNEKIELLESLGFKRGIRVTLDDAIAEDLVAPYELFIITFKPDAVTRNMEAGNKTAKWLTTERAVLTYADVRIDNAKKTRNENTIKFAYFNRMRIIKTLPSRIDLTKRLLARLKNKFPEARILVFAPDIKTCEMVVPECFFHSKTDNSGFENFKAGTQRVCAAVGMLDEGVNVVADIAIIMSTLAGEKTIIQRLGRLLRKTSEGKVGKAFLLMAEETQEESWVSTATESLKNVTKMKVSSTQL